MRLLTRTLKARSSALQLVAVAVVLAIGGNLVASYIWDSLGNVLSFWIGASAVILIVVVLAISEIRGLEECVKVSGLMLTNKGAVVRVPEYGLSSDMHAAFEAILNENEAIRNQWKQSPLPSAMELDKVSQNQSVKLVLEVMEFVLLEKLSGHLADSSLLRNDQIRAFERSDLLPLLPDNRVLDALTRPIEDRIALVRARDGGSDTHFVTVQRLRYPGDKEGELWHATDGKHMYTRVSLELPKASQVQRVHPGHIRIDSKYVRLDLYTDFEGMNANVDELFVTRYLGLPPRVLGEERVKAWQTEFAIGTKIKLRGLVSPKAWKLYRWSETFVDACQKDFGEEEFYEAIGWAQTRTLLITQENSPEYRRRIKADKKREVLKEQIEDKASAETKPAP